MGKSTAVRNLAKRFDYFIEINFDEQPEYLNLFANTSDLHDLIEQLALITQTEIIEGKTLLFLDEIQASLPAISKLRYFYEKRPNLHVIAAGSLLEFALAELPSFGVGRVRSLFMYPLSFTEFLGAVNEKPLARLIQQSNAANPINPIVHNKLKIYFAVLLIFDTGIYQRILGLDVASLLLKDDFEVMNKGSIAELFVGLELLKSSDAYEKTALYYWHREAKNSKAEVDYVVQRQDRIVPVEVKAGTKGAMLHPIFNEWRYVVPPNFRTTG